MTKNNKILIAVLITVIIIAAVLWPKKTKAQKMEEQYGTNNNTNTNSNSGAAAPPKVNVPPTSIPGVPADIKDNFPLKLGSRGDNVRRLQQIINFTNRRHNISVTPLTEDGIFGPKTDKAVRMWFSNGEVTKQSFDVINNLFLSNNPIPVQWRKGDVNKAVKGLAGLNFSLLKF